MYGQALPVSSYETVGYGGMPAFPAQSLPGVPLPLNSLTALGVQAETVRQLRFVPPDKFDVLNGTSR